MTSPGSAHDAHAAPRTLSIVILGADAVLAAAPASPVQLAHACMQAGYDAVVPASWGDELIASKALRELRDRPHGPAIQCSCPLVARRLLSLGTELRPFLVSLVSPPVATARYLRTVHAPTRLRITYAGRCPGAVDDDIDARVSPEELLAIFADRHIALCDQPTAFDSIIPPDRRRFYSLPGGVPRREPLRAVGARELVEVDGADVSIELAQILLAGTDVLADAAPALGCMCCGAGDGRSAEEARARVAAVEPPLATGPVVDDRVPIDLLLPVAAAARRAPEIAASLPVTPAADLWTAEVYVATSATSPHHERAELGAAPVSLPADAVVPVSRRRSPGQGVRALVGTTPIARDAEGRHLPRAYVARRRSTPRGLRAITGEPAAASRIAKQPAERLVHAPERDEAAPNERVTEFRERQPLVSTVDTAVAESGPRTAWQPAPSAVVAVPEEPRSETSPGAAPQPGEVSEPGAAPSASTPAAASAIAAALAEPPELMAREAVDVAATGAVSTAAIETPAPVAEPETPAESTPVETVSEVAVPAAEAAAEPSVAASAEVPPHELAQPWSQRRDRRPARPAEEAQREARGSSALRYIAIGAGLALLVVVSAALGALLSQFLR